jgi:DNA-binding transcriptional ArsR family regulator
MNLDQTFAALADPIRRAIVSRLAKGDATVLELAEPFAVSLPAISRHLKVLERAGLITRSRNAQHRPCSLRGESLGAVVEWAEHTQAAWEARFDRLNVYLQEMQQPTPKEKKHGRKKQ